MPFLLLRAFCLLLYVDALLRRSGTRKLKAQLAESRMVRRERAAVASEQLVRAVDLASVAYMKPVLCLQRSMATTLLLRQYGFEADLVIGATVVPFRAHAWVELDGAVVNDKSYVREMYLEVERIGNVPISGGAR